MNQVFENIALDVNMSSAFDFPVFSIGSHVCLLNSQRTKTSTRTWLPSDVSTQPRIDKIIS